jgi:hypothetical protein
MPRWIILTMKNVTLTKAKRQHVRKQLPYPPYVKNTNPYIHVWVFKIIIRANGETENKNIVNMFIFTLCDTIIKWSYNFLTKHCNNFAKLEHVYYKKFKFVNNNE